MNDISLLDLLEDGGILCNTHTQQLFCSPVLIENVVSVLSQLLHVGANEHLSELHKIAVVLVVHLNDTPGVRTSADLATVRCFHNFIRAYNGKRNLASDLFSLGDGLLIFVFISGCLEDMDIMMGNVGQDLRWSRALEPR